MILVSECLVGVNCKYSGGNNYSQAVLDYIKDKQYITLCPEMLGGLSTPRHPCEIVNDKILNSIGEDVTKEFYLGADKAVEIALSKGVTLAILQVRSPSCGVGRIYDGSFSSKLIDGNGIFAQKLIDAGIEVLSDAQLIEQIALGLR